MLISNNELGLINFYLDEYKYFKYSYYLFIFVFIYNLKTNYRLGVDKREDVFWSLSFTIKFLLCIYLGIHYSSIIVLLYSKINSFSIILLFDSLFWILTSSLIYFEYRRKLPQTWKGLKGFWTLTLLFKIGEVLRFVLGNIEDYSQKYFMFIVINECLSMIILFILSLYSVIKSNDHSNESKNNHYCIVEIEDGKTQKINKDDLLFYDIEIIETKNRKINLSLQSNNIDLSTIYLNLKLKFLIEKSEMINNNNDNNDNIYDITSVSNLEKERRSLTIDVTTEDNKRKKKENPIILQSNNDKRSSLLKYQSEIKRKTEKSINDYPQSYEPLNESFLNEVKGNIDSYNFYEYSYKKSLDEIIDFNYSIIQEYRNNNIVCSLISMLEEFNYIAETYLITKSNSIEDLTSPHINKKKYSKKKVSFNSIQRKDSQLTEIIYSNDGGERGESQEYNELSYIYYTLYQQNDNKNEYFKKSLMKFIKFNSISISLLKDKNIIYNSISNSDNLIKKDWDSSEKGIKYDLLKQIYLYNSLLFEKEKIKIKVESYDSPRTYYFLINFNSQSITEFFEMKELLILILKFKDIPKINSLTNYINKVLLNPSTSDNIYINYIQNILNELLNDPLFISNNQIFTFFKIYKLLNMTEFHDKPNISKYAFPFFFQLTQYNNLNKFPLSSYLHFLYEYNIYNNKYYVQFLQTSNIELDNNKSLQGGLLFKIQLITNKNSIFEWEFSVIIIEIYNILTDLNVYLSILNRNTSDIIYSEKMSFLSDQFINPLIEIVSNLKESLEEELSKNKSYNSNEINKESMKVVSNKKNSSIIIEIKNNIALLTLYLNKLLNDNSFILCLFYRNIYNMLHMKKYFNNHTFDLDSSSEISTNSNKDNDTRLNLRNETDSSYNNIKINKNIFNLYNNESNKDLNNITDEEYLKNDEVNSRNSNNSIVKTLIK